MTGIIISTHLVVQVGKDHVGTRTLGQGTVSSVAADSVVTVNHSLAVLVKACNQVEGVVWEKSTGIECFREEMGN